MSAIDDSVETIHFQRTPLCTSHLCGPALTQENYGRSGPRSGHWTVDSTDIGSGIDDGCPNMHGYEAAENRTSRRAQPLPRAVLKKLVKVTEARNHTSELQLEAPEAVPVVEAVPVPAEDETVVSAQFRLPKGLFAPQAAPRGVRITSKDGKQEVIRPPKNVAAPPISKTAKQSPKPGTNAKQEVAKSPELSVQPVERPLAGSQQSERCGQGVRIVGKNGEEACVELPLLRSPFKSASQHSFGPDRPASGRVHQAQRARQDERAASIAQQLRQEREIDGHAIERCSPVIKSATPQAMMSGALPPGTRTPLQASPIIQAKKARSAKSSIVASTAEPERKSLRSSRAPGVASSKTTMVPAMIAENEELSHRSSPTIRTARSKSWISGHQQTRPNGGASLSPREKYARHSSLHSRRCSVHSRNSADDASETSDSTVATVGSSLKTRREATNVPEFAAEGTVQDYPTLFAGTGWISPHPLSRVASEVEPRPQPSIKIPSRNGMQEGVTMTYDEWRSMRHGANAYAHNECDDALSYRSAARKSSPRSTDEAGRRYQGSWGPRGSSAQPTQLDRGAGRAASYRSPTVGSNRSGGSEKTYEHAFEETGSQEGWTQLRMPWDQ